MPAMQSFDITVGCDLQEVDNAVNQAQKELSTRYDFRGIKFEINFLRDKNQIQLAAPDDYKLKAIWDVIQTKMVKRGVPIKNLHPKDPEAALGGSLRQTIELQQGIPTEKAREIIKFIKELKVKKVQGQIQADQIRVQSPSRDELQEVMAHLRKQDFGVELKFGNFRG